MTTKTQARLLFAAALVVGTVRFLRLDAWSLWLDEAFTMADSLHGPVAQKNPLGYWLYDLWLSTRGHRPTEFDLRLPSALFGWLAIPLSAWAFRPLAGVRGAAVCALVVATSPWQLYWSQTARFYTLAEVMSLVGAGLYLRGLLAQRRAPLLIGIAIASSAVLAHPSAVLVPPALIAGPWLLHFFRRSVPGFPGRLGLPLVVLGVLGLVAGAGWIADVWSGWEETKGIGNPKHFVLSTGFYVGPPLGAVALAGAWLAWRRRDATGSLALVCAASGLAAGLVASILARVSAQYVFVLFPWIAVVAALPFADSADEEGPPGPHVSALRLGLLLVLVLPALASTALYFTVRHGERPRWREAYRYVLEHMEPTDRVLGMEAPVGEYYLSPRTTNLREDLVSVEWLDTYRSARPMFWTRWRQPIWFVVNIEQLEDWERREDKDAFLAMLREECRLEAAFPVQMDARDVNVWVYKRD